MKRHLKAKKIIDDPKRSSKHSLPVCRSQFDSSSSSQEKEAYKRSTPIHTRRGDRKQYSMSDWAHSVSDIIFSTSESITDSDDDDSFDSFSSANDKTYKRKMISSKADCQSGSEKTFSSSIFDRSANDQPQDKSPPHQQQQPQAEVMPKTPENDIFEALFDAVPLEAEIEFGDFPKELFPYSKKSKKKFTLDGDALNTGKVTKKGQKKANLIDEMNDLFKCDKRIQNLKKTEPTLDRLVFACEIVRIANWTVDLRWNNLPNSKGYLYMFLTKHYPKVRILVTRDHSDAVSEIFFAFSLCSPTKFAVHEQNLHINFDDLDIVSIMFTNKPICHAFLGLVELSNQMQLESALLDTAVRKDREKAFLSRGYELMKYLRAGYTVCGSNQGIVMNAVEDRDLYHNRIMAENRFFSLFCNVQNYSTIPSK